MTCEMNNFETEWSLCSALMSSLVVGLVQSTNQLTNQPFWPVLGFPTVYMCLDCVHPTREKFCIREEFWNVYWFMTVLDRPDVTLCTWQDVKHKSSSLFAQVSPVRLVVVLQRRWRGSENMGGKAGCLPQRFAVSILPGVRQSTYSKI